MLLNVFFQGEHESRVLCTLSNKLLFLSNRVVSYCISVNVIYVWCTVVCSACGGDTVGAQFWIWSIFALPGTELFLGEKQCAGFVLGLLRQWFGGVKCGHNLFICLGISLLVVVK